jgi:hypothetical protein
MSAGAVASILIRWFRDNLSAAANKSLDLASPSGDDMIRQQKISGQQETFFA